MLIAQLWDMLTQWLPSWFAIAILSIITILVIVLIIKLIGFVMDAIPFV